MTAVKECQSAASPNTERKEIGRNVAETFKDTETTVKITETKVAEVKVTETSLKSPDQADVDSDSSSGDGSGMCVFVYYHAMC